MADLTYAVEMAAKGAYAKLAEARYYPPWKQADALTRHTWRNSARPYVTALHEAGLLKEAE
ncbi:hypothetical protein [Timonella senegalensis]|uniref:hypothetical protein n=1 Tax=Timonella senegalensis TaxID=1465825 RepID=UPI002FDE4D08